MDLDDLVLFARVVEEGSISGAALAAGITESLAGQRLGLLEERLGAQLLDLTSGELKVTEVGVAYYEQCARVAAQLQKAEREVLEMNAEARGMLRVTAPPEFTVLGELAAAFLEQHPKLEIELEFTTRSVDMIAEGYDLAIRTGHLADSSLLSRKLGDCVFALYAAPSYLEKRGEPRDAKQLVEHTCVVFGEPQRWRRWQLPNPRGIVAVEVRGRLYTNNLLTARDAAIAGAGVVMLPSRMGDRAVSAGQLRRILDGVSPLQGAVYALYPDSRRVPVKVSAFVDFLAQDHPNAPWAV